MAKRLKQQELRGPNGEIVKANWMPGGRLRLDFIECSPVVVTKIFPAPNATHIEVSHRSHHEPTTN